ncbi:MAG: hypothetical protein WAM91_16770 [Candidatus Acidiferrales bacterium]
MRVRSKIIWCALIVAAIAAVVWLEVRNRVAFNSVVEIDMRGPIEERAQAGSSGATMQEITSAIDAARDDRRVGGLLLEIGDANGRPAVLEEIAAHVRAFGKSGKASICFYDEEDDDVRAERLASACYKKLGEGPGTDDDVEEFFNERLGEDNWSRIEMGEYLRKARGDT